MATETVVQRTRFNSCRNDSKGAWLFSSGSAREEARLLVGLMQRSGASVEDIRELIAIPSRVERSLRIFAQLLYARQEPNEARGIERVLAFRKRVGEEFERLVFGAHRRPFDSPLTMNLRVPTCSICQSRSVHCSCARPRR